MSKFGLKDVQHIANLARLTFDEQEMESYQYQLSRILDYIEKLNQLDTEGVPPTSHVIPIRNVMKPDEEREVEVRLVNHSPVKRTFTVTPRHHRGAQVLSKPGAVVLSSRSEGAVKVKIRAPKKPGVYGITADIESKGMHFKDWVETVIEVK